MVPPEIGNLIAVIARLTNYNHHQIAKSQDKKIFDISKGFRSLTHFLVNNTFFTRKKKIYYRRNLVVTYITILDSMNFTLNAAIISFGKMIRSNRPPLTHTDWPLEITPLPPESSQRTFLNSIHLRVSL